MNPTPRRPLQGHSHAACVRPLPPEPKTSLFPVKTASEPQHIGSILDDILRSPGGYVGAARRTLASNN